MGVHWTRIVHNGPVCFLNRNVVRTTPDIRLKTSVPIVIPAQAGIHTSVPRSSGSYGKHLCLIGALVVAAAALYLYKVRAAVSYFEKKSIKSSTG